MLRSGAHDLFQAFHKSERIILNIGDLVRSKCAGLVPDLLIIPQPDGLFMVHVQIIGPLFKLDLRQYEAVSQYDSILKMYADWIMRARV